MRSDEATRYHVFNTYLALLQPFSTDCKSTLANGSSKGMTLYNKPVEHFSTHMDSARGRKLVRLLNLSSTYTVCLHGFQGVSRVIMLTQGCFSKYISSMFKKRQWLFCFLVPVGLC